MSLVLNSSALEESILHGSRLHPLHAAPLHELAPQILAPVERLGHVHVRLVPTSIFHQGERDARINRILCVSSRHGLVLERPFLPVSQGRACIKIKC